MSIVEGLGLMLLIAGYMFGVWAVFNKKIADENYKKVLNKEYKPNNTWNYIGMGIFLAVGVALIVLVLKALF